MRPSNPHLHICIILTSDSFYGGVCVLGEEGSKNESGANLSKLRGVCEWVAGCSIRLWSDLGL